MPRRTGFPTFDLREIDFAIGTPEDFNDAEIEEMQVISLTATREHFRRTDPDITEAQIRHVVRADDPAYFVASRRDPQAAVDRGDLNPADFSKPRIVVARQAGILVGYLTSWDTTTGKTALERSIKMRLSPTLDFIPKAGGRRYAWQREAAVHPKVQHRGIAHVLGYLSLGERHPKQPAKDYSYPSLFPDIDHYQERTLRMHRSEVDTKDVLGTNKKFVMTSYQKLVGDLLYRISRIPGANEAIASVDAVRLEHAKSKAQIRMETDGAADELEE